MANTTNSKLALRLKQEMQGDILFDDFSRGRYSTDASIYQLMPVGVVIPVTEHDVQVAVQIAAEEGVPPLRTLRKIGRSLAKFQMIGGISVIF